MQKIGLNYYDNFFKMHEPIMKDLFQLKQKCFDLKEKLSRSTQTCFELVENETKDDLAVFLILLCKNFEAKNDFEG